MCIVKSELFGVDKRTVSEHLTNIFASGELQGNSVVRKFRTTAADGKTYQVKHYNLDAIISVGYRVNSKRATQFRIWATKVLRDFTLQGYVIARQRMEQGEIFGEDYFEQLLQEIREIRMSERRFYQKVTDIYATATDYDKDAPVTKQFFATVQNKLHFAVHGQTAAELIRARASADKPHMGLPSWGKGPKGKVLAGGCDRRQELPVQVRAGRSWAAGRSLPNSRGEQGSTTHSHHDGAVGECARPPQGHTHTPH